MPLTSYEDVRPWARAIKEQVLTRRMPKWHAARGFGAFTNDPTLTPSEMAMIVAWVDGGLPRGGGPFPRAAPAVKANTTDTLITVSAASAEGRARVRARWISGWSFEPGDPLITAATFTSADGRAIGTWVAGDRRVMLPANSAIRISSPVRVRLRRRPAADFEQPYTARPSILRFASRRAPPRRRVWTEALSCVAPSPAAAARVLAVRPLLAEGGSARLAIQRTGAPATILGWFRNFDPAFARMYWLARPAEFGVDARITSDAPCSVELWLAAP